MYAVTIKKTGGKDYVDPDDYYVILEILGGHFGYYEIHMVRFELDKKNRLHMHFSCVYNPYRTLKSLRGYHTHINKLRTSFDIDSWHDYISKCLRNDAIQMNEIYHKYCFI